jgi:hypothetical protein
MMIADEKNCVDNGRTPKFYDYDSPGETEESYEIPESVSGRDSNVFHLDCCHIPYCYVTSRFVKRLKLQLCKNQSQLIIW